MRRWRNIAIPAKTPRSKLHCIVWCFCWRGISLFTIRLSYFCFSHRRKKHESLISGYSLMYLKFSERMFKKTSKQNLCFNLEVETVTDLYNLWNWDNPNGLRVPKKNQMNSFLLITTFALETWREIQMTKKRQSKASWIYFTYCYVGGEVALRLIPIGHIDTEDETDQVNQRNL